MDLLDEMRRLVVRLTPDGGQRKIPGGVTLASVDRPTPPVGAISEPSLAIVAQGVKRTVLNGVPYDYRAGQYLVVSVDLPVVGQALEASPDRPFTVFSMSLSPAAIAPLLLEHGAGGEPGAFTGMAVSDATPELLDPVVRLLRVADRPDDLRVLAPGYQREILWWLINGDQGALVRQIGLVDGNLARVSRGIRWIRDHYREQLSIADLADLCGMSASSLHRHFRAATSMTPVQFQKQIRLQAARTLLMTRSGNVAEVGYFVGYESASQFSREYRKAFGVSPGRDAAQLARLSGA
ncbi:AraC family transcriptional regulator [Herbidospora cretacea]|uniref:AraC family transcriptional regulator n=1 Tax=Herbidospora cretacea TaxID=28444 RepID=UPI0007746881|nr:AraC family transcriptional regulator [Herbidospora cretacea]